MLFNQLSVILIKSFNLNKLFSYFCFQFENFSLPSIVVKLAVLKNIVSIKNLIAFYEKYPDAKTSIETWVSIAKSANWQKPSDVINDFSKAKTLKNKRIVFKISKNRYRIIAQISYQKQWIFIRFIGTHAEYDKIDANIVEQY